MTQPTSQFAVVTDGGLDALPTLRNNVPVAPFSVNFGEKSIPMNRITREEFYRELATNPVHPTSSQPSPQQWLDAYAAVPSGTLRISLPFTIASALVAPMLPSLTSTPSTEPSLTSALVTAPSLICGLPTLLRATPAAYDAPPSART